jgi:hypothetical protein
MAEQSSLFMWLRRHAAWLIVAAVILFSVAVRVRLRDLPLERDEGEYAYAGQLILQGIPPYKLAFNMKLPGTYAAYALIMAIFGQSASGIHIGLALLTAGSIAMMFLLGRHLLDEIAGVTAAIIFALMSLSPSVLGLAAHATHFVVFFSLAGILVLVKASSSPDPSPPAEEREHFLRPVRQATTRNLGIFLSGILFGLAFLMKQHGILFALFGLSYLAWIRVTAGVWVEKKERNSSRSSRRSPRTTKLVWAVVIKESLLYVAGLILPFALTCAALAVAGVFKEFTFWTFTYAAKYVSAIPMSEGPAYLRSTLGRIFSDNPYFWILAGLGAVIIWWEDRLKGQQIILTLLLLCSAAAVSAGLYFREHYFIQLLPILALLGAIAVSRAIYLIKTDRSIELLLAAASLILIGVATIVSFVVFGPLWFSLNPDEASDRIYGSSLFSACAQAGHYIKAHSQSTARVAVLGSEPEIYFYSQRLSATGYIYVYPMMDSHDYARKMQEQLINEIETQKPEFIVFMNVHFSWLGRESSPHNIFKWWQAYWNTRYQIETTIPISVSRDELAADVSITTSDLDPSKFLLILKRED